MKRTINTPHDVVQMLIDIIVTNENRINIFTQYLSRLNQVKVTITTIQYLYVCYYEITGDSVMIYKFKRVHSSSSKVLEASIFKVNGDTTYFINVDSFPQKIKTINL